MEIDNVRFASVGARFLAMLIDGLLLGFIGFLFFGSGDSYAIPDLSMSIGPLLLSAVYFILQEGSSRRATLGKRVMNIHVMSSTSSPMDYGKATIRYFAKILSAMILLIGYIMALFSKKKLSLHDIIAKTQVVKD